MNTEFKFDYNNVVNFLKNHVAEITFTKSNGQTRVLVGTLMPGSVPDSNVVNTDEEVVTVWDTVKNAYRSFRMDSVTSFVQHNK